MGGNVKVIDRISGKLKEVDGKTIGADKIDFNQINRQEFQSEFLQFLNVLNKLFFKSFNKHIWSDLPKLIKTKKLFNGSSRFGFDNDISNEDFNKYKGSMGDIDLVVPREFLPDLFSLLAKNEQKDITPKIFYIGQNKKEQFGEQINALFSFNNEINFQVDFEGVEFKDDLPDDFANFGHSSNWEDIKLGLKGVSHKYLIMNLVRALTYIPSDSGILLTPKSSIDPNDSNFKISKTNKYLKTHAFSINKGLREKLIKVGELNNIPMFKELPTSESYYERRIPEIYRIIFSSQPSDIDLRNFYSFYGTINLIKKNVDREKLEIMLLFLIEENLFGKSAQKLDRYSMKIDFDIKLKMLELLFKQFPSLLTKEIKRLIQERVNTFYQPDNYFQNNQEKTINNIKLETEDIKMTHEEKIRKIIQEEIKALIFEDSKLQKSLRNLLIIIKNSVGKSYEKQIKRVYISSDQSKWVEIELKSVNQTLALNLLKDEISYGNNKIENLFKIKNTIPSKSWEEYSEKLNDFSNEISEILKVYEKLKKSKKIKEFIDKEL